MRTDKVDTFQQISAELGRILIPLRQFISTSDILDVVRCFGLPARLHSGPENEWPDAVIGPLQSLRESVERLFETIKEAGDADRTTRVAAIQNIPGIISLLTERLSIVCVSWQAFSQGRRRRA